MLVTEEEARLNWCFHFIASHTDPRERNYHDPRERVGSPDYLQHTCLGSECMAWRWAPGEQKWDAEAQQWKQTMPSNTGYCGLAGRPE